LKEEKRRERITIRLIKILPYINKRKTRKENERMRASMIE